MLSSCFTNGVYFGIAVSHLSPGSDNPLGLEQLVYLVDFVIDPLLFKPVLDNFLQHLKAFVLASSVVVLTGHYGTAKDTLLQSSKDLDH